MGQRTRYREPGTPVCVTAKKMPRGKGLSYGSFCGRLVEGARVGPAAGWDVVDVRTSSGKVRSVYSFSLNPRPGR